MAYTLFFEAIPNPQPDADVIAIVSLSDVIWGTATAKITQVLKTSDARVHESEKFAMKYRFTSCGPNHNNGDEGTIIARVGNDSKGSLVLYPYMRRRGDGRIREPQFISE